MMGEEIGDEVEGPQNARPLKHACVSRRPRPPPPPLGRRAALATNYGLSHDRPPRHPQTSGMISIVPGFMASVLYP